MQLHNIRRIILLFLTIIVVMFAVSCGPTTPPAPPAPGLSVSVNGGAEVKAISMYMAKSALTYPSLWIDVTVKNGSSAPTIYEVSVSGDFGKFTEYALPQAQKPVEPGKESKVSISTNHDKFPNRLAVEVKPYSK